MLMLLKHFKFQDQLSELLIALEEKSMKIEEFVSDIELLFNTVEVSPVVFVFFPSLKLLLKYACLVL